MSMSSMSIEIESGHSLCASFSHVGPCHQSSELPALVLALTGRQDPQDFVGLDSGAICLHLKSF